MDIEQRKTIIASLETNTVPPVQDSKQPEQLIPSVPVPQTTYHLPPPKIPDLVIMKGESPKIPERLTGGQFAALRLIEEVPVTPSCERGSGHKKKRKSRAKIEQPPPPPLPVPIQPQTIYNLPPQSEPPLTEYSDDVERQSHNIIEDMKKEGITPATSGIKIPGGEIIATDQVMFAVIATILHGLELALVASGVDVHGTVEDLLRSAYFRPLILQVLYENIPSVMESEMSGISKLLVLTGSIMLAKYMTNTFPQLMGAIPKLPMPKIMQQTINPQPSPKSQSSNTASTIDVNAPVPSNFDQKLEEYPGMGIPSNSQSNNNYKPAYNE